MALLVPSEREHSASERADIAVLQAKVAALELAQELAQELALERERAPKTGAWKPWLAGAGTASVTLLAFLIPSLQEQWDRHVQSAAVEEYRVIAHELMHQRQYKEAEAALEHALELHGSATPELERERLVAKTAQVNSNRQWGGKIDDESLEEADFELLEVMQARAGEHAEHAWTLNNHAVFLVHQKQAQRALPLLERAQAESPRDARIWVTIGNVRWDQGNLDAAHEAYRRALALAPDEVTAHYNLALLHEEQGDLPAARSELLRVLALQPQDAAREDLTRLSQDSPSHS